MYLLAHLDYFKNAEDYVKDDAMNLREDIVDWLIDPDTEITAIGVMDWSRSLVAAVVGFSLVGLLAVLAAATIVGVGSVGQHLLTTATPTAKVSVAKAIYMAAAKFLGDIRTSFTPLLCGALAILLLAGLSRWISESWSDWQLIRGSAQGTSEAEETVRKMAPPHALDSTIWLQSCQLVASLLGLLITILVIARWGFAGDGPLLARIAALLIGAICLQSAINRAPGPPQPT